MSAAVKFLCGAAVLLAAGASLSLAQSQREFLRVGKEQKDVSGRLYVPLTPIRPMDLLTIQESGRRPAAGELLQCETQLRLSPAEVDGERTTVREQLLVCREAYAASHSSQAAGESVYVIRGFAFASH